MFAFYSLLREAATPEAECSSNASASIFTSRSEPSNANSDSASSNTYFNQENSSLVKRAASVIEAADEYLYNVEVRLRTQLDLPPLDDEEDANTDQEDNRLRLAEEGLVFD